MHPDYSAPSDLPAPIATAVCALAAALAEVTSCSPAEVDLLQVESQVRELVAAVERASVQLVLLLPYFDGRMAVGGGALSPTDGFLPAVTGLYGAVELESGVAGHVGHTKWALGYRAATVELWAAEELRSGGIYDIEGGMQSLAGWVMSIQYDL